MNKKILLIKRFTKKKPYKWVFDGTYENIYKNENMKKDY